MSFQGINFSSQHIVPSDDGRLYASIFEDGSLHGCELSYVGAALTIGAGYLMIGGREIEITEDEVFDINEATSGYAQLMLTIDLTQTATIGAFNQVSIDVRYASTEAGFASLIQDDINGAGTKYQQQLALVSLGTGGITGIVSGMPSASLKGAGRVFSIIAVTYPAGSTCTCSDGTTTLTARDTSGKALFNVPYAGTWTVTCTDGTNTKSESVEITSEGQSVSVELSYGLWLYKDGDTCDSVTGGWTSFTESSDNRVNFNSDNIYTYGKYVKTQHGAAAYAYPSRKIDLSKYASLRAKVSGVSYNSACQCGIMVNNSLTNVTNGVVSNHDELADFTAAAAASNGEISIDISTLEGEYYVLIGVTYGTANGASSLTCAEMWLA